MQEPDDRRDSEDLDELAELDEGVEDSVDIDDDEVNDEFLTPEGDYAAGMRAGDDERNEEEELMDEGGYGEYDPQQPGES